MSKHLKRLAAPRVLRVHRKERALTIRAALYESTSVYATRTKKREKSFPMGTSLSTG